MQPWHAVILESLFLLLLQCFIYFLILKWFFYANNFTVNLFCTNLFMHFCCFFSWCGHIVFSFSQRISFFVVAVVVKQHICINWLWFHSVVSHYAVFVVKCFDKMWLYRCNICELDFSRFVFYNFQKCALIFM